MRWLFVLTCLICAAPVHAQETKVVTVGGEYRASGSLNERVPAAVQIPQLFHPVMMEHERSGIGCIEFQKRILERLSISDRYSQYVIADIDHRAISGDDHLLAADVNHILSLHHLQNVY